MFEAAEPGEIELKLIDDALERVVTGVLVPVESIVNGLINDEDPVRLGVLGDLNGVWGIVGFELKYSFQLVVVM